MLLDCEPTPDAVHAARRERGVEWLTREVVERANFKTWLIDTGYGADTTFSLDELRDLAPCRIEEVLRLEPLIERLILDASSFDGFIDAYRAAIGGLRDRGIVGLKSVHRVPDRAAHRRRRPGRRGAGVRGRARGRRGARARCGSSRSRCSIT